MKKINLLAIIGIVILIICIGVVSLFLQKSSLDNEIILKSNTLSDIKNYVEKKDIENYYIKASTCYIQNINVLDKDAEIQISLENEEIKGFITQYILFEYVGTDDEKNGVESTEDTSIYQFSKDDKKKISSEMEELKDAFGEYLECDLENYDVIPTAEGIEIQDDDEKFFEGMFVKEYSVRDKDGTLWLLRFNAGYGMAGATLIKVFDESAYEGFIPIIDLSN